MDWVVKRPVNPGHLRIVQLGGQESILATGGLYSQGVGRKYWLPAVADDAT